MALDNGQCAACGREGCDLYRHHLVPCVQGGRRGPTVNLCGPCHEEAHGVTRNDLAALTRQGLAAVKARGMRYGQVPFGYQLAADGVTLQRDDQQQATKARMAAWRRAGMSLQRIAQRLTADGVPTANGGRWWGETVKSILTAATPDADEEGE